MQPAVTQPTRCPQCGSRSAGANRRPLPGLPARARARRRRGRRPGRRAGPRRARPAGSSPCCRRKTTARPTWRRTSETRRLVTLDVVRLPQDGRDEALRQCRARLRSLMRWSHPGVPRVVGGEIQPVRRLLRRVALRERAAARPLLRRAAGGRGSRARACSPSSARSSRAATGAASVTAGCGRTWSWSPGRAATRARRARLQRDARPLAVGGRRCRRARRGRARARDLQVRLGESVADLLECLIQIKGLADTPRRLAQRAAEFAASPSSQAEAAAGVVDGRASAARRRDAVSPRARP